MNDASAKVRILIVDDVPSNLETLGGILQPYYRVLAATSGHQALTIAARDPRPDLILLDIMMSGMDGYEVLSRLQDDAECAEIPVLFVTALDEDVDEERGLRLGAVDYITKPLRPPVVLARVATQLQLLRARRLLADRNRHLETLVEERTGELVAARDAAEAASRAKSAFLANMSHEILNPLNGVLGYAQVLARADDLPMHHRKAVEVIRRNGQRLQVMIEDVLELARIESGRSRSAPVNCDIHRMLKELEETSRERAAARGLGFDLSIPEPLPAAIRIDAGRVRRVLELLLDNAMELADEGAIRLVVRQADGRLMLDVSDTGPGIDPARLEHLLQSFQRYDETDQGLHVGLALVRGLAEVLGGQMEIANRPGEGTGVTLALPFEPVQPA